MGTKENNEEVKLKDRIIKTFEEFSNSDNYWKDPSEVAQYTGTTVQQVHNIVDSFSDFVENRYGKITTRKIYTKYAPFFTQFYHAWIGKIE
jgi:hypothetical protein